jgi:hypothetical protein
MASKMMLVDREDSHDFCERGLEIARGLKLSVQKVERELTLLESLDQSTEHELMHIESTNQRSQNEQKPANKSNHQEPTPTTKINQRPVSYSYRKWAIIAVVLVLLLVFFQT